MASFTASLERSLQNCSLDNQSTGGGDGGVGLSATSDTPDNQSSGIDNNNTLELNSHVALPYQWEQCLDLKTGEIYYINWMNGTKIKEDPRMFSNGNGNGDSYFTEEEEDNSSSYDSEGSSQSESSPSSSSTPTDHHHNTTNIYRNNESDHQVLVVAGCKSCLMYFMLPKRVEECPKCNGLLLHFDRSDNDDESP